MLINAAALNSTWLHVSQTALFNAAGNAIMPQHGIEKYILRFNAEQRLGRRNGRLETTGEAPGLRGARNYQDLSISIALLRFGVKAIQSPRPR